MVHIFRIDDLVTRHSSCCLIFFTLFFTLFGFYSFNIYVAGAFPSTLVAAFFKYLLRSFIHLLYTLFLFLLLCCVVLFYYIFFSFTLFHCNCFFQTVKKILMYLPPYLLVFCMFQVQVMLHSCSDRLFL